MPESEALRRAMVDSQIRPSDVTKYPVLEAMLAIPREPFVPDSHVGAAHADSQIPLGGGRYMLEPRTFAKMLDTLDIRPDELVLDLGSGLGYSAAVIGHIADFVIAVEEDEGLAAEAERRLPEAGIDNAAVIAGPLAEGDARHGPYDVIVLEGAIETLPDALAAQLKEGGRIAAIFSEGVAGRARIGVKVAGRIDWHDAFDATAPVLRGFEKKKEFAL
ncbi:MAG: protein-L-isoaspartate O-methyltransferase [Alphaproteobacteria bacterium]|nr:MAG: protein-L-isoaspartate O-methyltransferase [Alphaproteobacteria bacterium]